MKEETFPKTTSSTKGSDTGWKVEARISEYRESPIELLGQRIGHKWREMQFMPGSPDGENVGILAKRSYTGTLEYFHLLPYPTAQALRWQLHAAFEALDNGAALALNTRLIKHDVKYELSSTPVGEYVPISGEDRSCILPDWNKSHLEKIAAKEQSANVKNMLIDRLNLTIAGYEEKCNNPKTFKTQAAKYRTLIEGFQQEIEEIEKSA